MFNLLITNHIYFTELDKHSLAVWFMYPSFKNHKMLLRVLVLMDKLHLELQFLANYYNVYGIISISIFFMLTDIFYWERYWLHLSKFPSGHSSISRELALHYDSPDWGFSRSHQLRSLLSPQCILSLTLPQPEP